MCYATGNNFQILLDSNFFSWMMTGCGFGVIIMRAFVEHCMSFMIFVMPRVHAAEGVYL